MADLQSAFVSAVIGGVIVALINNLFARSNKDNEWRRQHLIEDKNKVREHLENMNKEFRLLQYKKYEFSSGHIEQRKWLLSLLKMYQDINNPYSKLICDSYEELFDCSLQAVTRDEDYKNNNLDIYSTDQDHEAYGNFHSKELKPILNKCDDIVNKINLNIGKYFSYYYPQPSIWSRIKLCLCGK